MPPTQKQEFLTPQLARQWLLKNTRNRPISETHVFFLQDEMRSGRWQYNGEAIKWSITHEILDGGHRLTALARMPDDFPEIKFLVVRGLPPETQDTMDQVRKRGAGDQMRIDGLVGAGQNQIAGAIRVYVPWVEGDLFIKQKRNHLSNPRVIQWAREHPDEILLFEKLMSIANFRRFKARPSVSLAAFLRFYLIDPDDCEEFISSLSSGAGLDEGSPILTLREKLNRINTAKTMASDRDIIALYVTAWNAWRSGRKMHKFVRPAGGAWSKETFPEPA